MLPAISVFIRKTFKVYFSSFKKLIPYFFFLFFVSLLIFLAGSSKVWLFLLIPSSYIRFVVHILGVIFFSFLLFVISIAVIRLVNNVYQGITSPKFWTNIKQSFALAFKNILALVFLGVPTILTYLVFFLGFLGHVSIWLLALFYLLIIFIGILFFFWLSFALVSISLENMKLWNSVKNSISIVKGRVWSIFIRLFLPSLLVYFSFGIFNSLIRLAFGLGWIYIIALFVLGILIIPFGVVVPTVLYLEIKQNNSQKEELKVPEFIN